MEEMIASRDGPLEPQTQPPVLIIGAGIAGLVLGHALKKAGIPFKIFERDAAANSRLQGWALTIHFCLPELLSMLEQEVIAAIDQVQVNPGLKIDKSDSIFVSLADCSVKWRLPPGSGDRKRVSRDRFRQLLIDGVAEHVLWKKKLLSFEPLESLSQTNGSPVSGVDAWFEDGSNYQGLVLVGVDGANSKVRKALFPPEVLKPKPLPVSFLGTSLVAGYAQVAPLLALDSTLFQGCHPVSKTWMWFSVMESPETNGSIVLPLEQRVWKIQLCLSWPVDSASNMEEIPITDWGRVLKLREKAECFDPRLRAVFADALTLDHGPILSISLADWYLPVQNAADLEGRVTLAGDSAHTMAMYRGEGFNHSVIDVHELSHTLQRIYDTAERVNNSADVRIFEEIRRKEMTAYNDEVRARGRSAVAMCREACIEVHHWDLLDSNSTVRKKRIL